MAYARRQETIHKLAFEPIDNYKLTTEEDLAHCFEHMKNTKELSDSLEQINVHLKNAPKDTSFFSGKQKHSRLNKAIVTIIDDINTYTLTTKEELVQRFNEMQNQKKFNASLEEITYIMNKIFGHGYADTNEHGIRINGGKRS